VPIGVLCAAAALGVAGGAALPLPAYRLSVPWRRAGEPPVPARSTCRECGHDLPAGVSGWLRPGSRCPNCGVRLGPRAWPLAVVCALACAGLAWRFWPSPSLVPYLLVVFLGVLIGTVDLAAQRIPDPLVLPGIAVAIVVFAGVAFATGDWTAYLRALAAGLVLFVGYFVLALLPGARLGGGDVALAGLLGVYLGWVGWPFAIAGAMLPWLLQAPVAVVALVARRAGKDTMLPLGPAMLAGAYVAVVGLPALVAVLAP
jgi:leader peptidase (prepilin peptidase)/N-methyltransferase